MLEEGRRKEVAEGFVIWQKGKKKKKTGQKQEENHQDWNISETKGNFLGGWNDKNAVIYQS